MPFHMAVFNTAALAQNSTNVALGTPADQALNIVNNQYQIPRPMKVLAGYAGIPNGTSARIQTPNLRRFILPQICPLSLTELPDNRPPLWIPKDQGPMLVPTEQFVVEVSRAGAAAADCAAVVWIGDNPTEYTGGPIWTVRCTGAITAVANAWAAGALTFPDVLPAGVYDIVGMGAYGANLVAARLIFPGGQIERPGVLAQGAQGEWNGEDMRFGNFGLFGTFRQWISPQLEVFANGANSAQVIELDLVYKGPAA